MHLETSRLCCALRQVDLAKRRWLGRIERIDPCYVRRGHGHPWPLGLPVAGGRPQTDDLPAMKIFDILWQIPLRYIRLEKKTVSKFPISLQLQCAKGIWKYAFVARSMHFSQRCTLLLALFDRNGVVNGNVCTVPLQWIVLELCDVAPNWIPRWRTSGPIRGPWHRAWPCPWGRLGQSRAPAGHWG